MKTGLKSLGIEANESPSPIAVFVPGPKKYNQEIHSRLLEKNILIPYNFYPGGPKEGFFRMAVTAKHTPDQIHKVIELLGNLISE
jgi:7-keto-8-aminopelargonate synthetase-like enzyme